MTPPASVLCRICGETIFMTTGKPISEASLAASSAVFATPSFGMVIPYASQTPRASGAVSACAPGGLGLIENLANGVLVVCHLNFLQRPACAARQITFFDRSAATSAAA